MANSWVMTLRSGRQRLAYRVREQRFVDRLSEQRLGIGWAKARRSFEREKTCVLFERAKARRSIEQERLVYHLRERRLAITWPKRVSKWRLANIWSKRVSERRLANTWLKRVSERRLVDAAKLQLHNIVSSNKMISQVSFSRGLDKTNTKIIINLQLFGQSINLRN